MKVTELLNLALGQFLRCNTKLNWNTRTFMASNDMFTLYYKIFNGQMTLNVIQECSVVYQTLIEQCSG